MGNSDTVENHRKQGNCINSCKMYWFVTPFPSATICSKNPLEIPVRNKPGRLPLRTRSHHTDIPYIYRTLTQPNDSRVSVVPCSSLYTKI